MPTKSITTVFPVADVAASVAIWQAILDTPPAFVDGGRWAQFNVGANRIALAGPGQGNGAPGLMIKVDDLEAARARLAEAGVAAGEVRTGAHERFCEVAVGDGCTATFYSPL